MLIWVCSNDTKKVNTKNSIEHVALRHYRHKIDNTQGIKLLNPLFERNISQSEGQSSADAELLNKRIKELETKCNQLKVFVILVI